VGKKLALILKNRDGWKDAQSIPEDLPNKDVKIPVGNSEEEVNA
jgi:hypothetical protein